MSSHREAPEISKDPVADSTDVYAFVSPDQADTVTLIANYVPLQAPAGGPNFYQFGDDVLYEIHIDNDGDGLAEIIYQFRFQDVLTDPSTFLYNTGPITSLDSPNWNRRQYYKVTRVDVSTGRARVLGERLACPPCNIGPLSTPHYEANLADPAIHSLSNGGKVFAGQRAEGFYVDLGAIFDLGTLRPFQADHVGDMLGNMPGISATKNVNVDTIAIQVPKSELRGSGPVIGVWTTASRQRVRIFGERRGEELNAGPFVQVSRLGNPLFNEVLIPIALKDFWNTQPPVHDKQFASHVAHPELAALLPVLYPGVFPHLAGYTKPRADLEAILLTGIPGSVLGLSSNFTYNGTGNQADQIRLNVDIPPASSPSNLGVIGGDVAGFPNGRRVFDDTTTIELRAIAGLTIPLVDPSYTPDAAAGSLEDPTQGIDTGLTGNGLVQDPTDLTARGTERYLATFPYLGQPYAGYDVPDNDDPAPVSSY